jgi:hypothetical protein
VKPKRRDIDRRDIEGRDTTRRVTPELLDFHIKRAHQVRVEAWRDLWRAIGALLVRLKRLWL